MVIRRWALVGLLCGLGACAQETEAEREARALANAVPKRLQADGSVLLSEADRAALGIEIASAAEGDVAEGRVRFGTVLVRHEDEGLLVMPLMGRIEKAPAIEVGQTLQPGDLIATIVPIVATIDQVSIASQKAAIDGQVATAAAELTTAEAELARGKKLQGEGLLSAQGLLVLDTAVATTKTRLAGLKAARNAFAQGQAAQIPLRSPFLGTLAFLESAVSLSLPAGRTVARVFRDGPRIVEVAMPVDDAPGVSFKLAKQGSAAAGKLLARGALSADDGLRRDRVEFTGAAPFELLPGATVAVRLFTATSHGVVVPEAALVASGDGALVFVQTAPGVYAPRTVTVGARGDGRVVILAGVKAGESIVVKGTAGLRGETLRGQLRHQD